ncbi:MAG TPA: hypothetical protein VMT50_04070 [Steroidobacteraceae bacterium]|nr:hypothetical protein [Steroidobacteraceae bacterium]
MQTKRPIVEFFAERFPAFRFIGEWRPILVFRGDAVDELFRAIALQRDGPSCGLATQLGVSYKPSWRGEPAKPMGLDTGLEHLRLGSRLVPIEEAWFHYEATREGLLETLEEIAQQLERYAPLFFDDAERRLRDNRLLQAALARAKSVPAEAKAGLEEACIAGGYRLDALTHPAYIQMRDYLQTLVTKATPEDEVGWLRSIAYSSLLWTTTT